MFTGDSDDVHSLALKDNRPDLGNTREVKANIAIELAKKGMHTLSAGIGAKVANEVRWLPYENTTWDDFARCISLVRFFRGVKEIAWVCTSPRMSITNLSNLPPQVAKSIKSLDDAYGKV